MMTDQLPFKSAPEPSARTQAGAQKARDDGGSLYKVILVPIDFSESSNRTLEYATHIAAREDANLWLLHVFRVPDYASTHYGWGPQNLHAAQEEALENLNEVAQGALGRGIKVKACFRVGHPVEEIVLLANDPEVDLVVIGSNGYSAIQRFLLGSTAGRVIEHAPCPVLVVKGRIPSA
jgi:nucleotide-binding universal stress UspA family protein